MHYRTQAVRAVVRLTAVWCLAASTGCQAPRPAHRADAGAPLTRAERDRAVALARFGQGMLHDLNDESGSALTNYIEAARLDPDNEELHFRAAMGLLRDQRNGEAIRLLQGLCERRPKSEKALFWLALAYRSDDDNDKAIATYKRASRVAPESPIPYLETANILVKSEREAEAIEVLSRGIKRVPEPVDLVKFTSDLVVRRVATGKATAADLRKVKSLLAEVQKAADRFPDDASLQHRLGDLHIIRGEPAEAIACFKRIEEQNPADLRTKQKLALSFLAMGDKSRAMESLERLAAEQPGNARIHYYLGEISERTGEKEKAIEYYKNAAACEPPEPAAYLKLSILLVDKDPDAALRLLSGARKRLPVDARMPEMMAYIELGRKHAAEALENFEQAQVLMAKAGTQPMTPNFDLHHAIALQMEGRIDDAANILSKAMGRNQAYLDAYIQYIFQDPDGTNLVHSIRVLESISRKTPDNEHVHAYIGMLRSDNEQFDTAVLAFEEAARLAEASAEPEDLLTPQFYFSYGAARERNGELDKADALFRKCIAADPEHAEAYNYVAYMWAEKGEKLDEALEFSKRSLELDPESPAFLDTLGWIYFMQGEYPKALKEIQRAANLLPEDPTIVAHFGDVMDKMGKNTRALTYWKRAFVLDPKNAELEAKLTGLGIDLEPLRKKADLRVQEQKNQKIKRAFEELSVPPEVNLLDTPQTAPAEE